MGVVVTHILICGSRKYADLEKVKEVVRALSDEDVIILSGGAAGVDQTAQDEALLMGFAVHIYEPNYLAFGRVAPHVRNDEMLKLADRVIVFHDGKSRGTASVIRKANSKKIPLELYAY